MHQKRTIPRAVLRGVAGENPARGLRAELYRYRHRFGAGVRRLAVVVSRRMVSLGVIQALTQASWPGNVRELQHYLERAHHHHRSRAQLQGHCGDGLGGGRARSPYRCARGYPPGGTCADSSGAPATGSNRAKVAKLLRISRASLHNKLRTYGMRDARSVTPRPALREALVFTPQYSFS